MINKNIYHCLKSQKGEVNLEGEGVYLKFD